MGVSTRVVLYAPSDSAAQRAARAAFARIAALEQVLSDYQPDSEVRRLCARAGGPAVAVSGDLAFALRRALGLARETDGAFDVTVQPVAALWRTARRTGRLPEAAALRSALQRVGRQDVQLDPRARSVRLARPGMCLDFGGIGKGYALDEALRALRARQVDRALLVMGGETLAGRAPPGRRGWRVEVEQAD
ncbi:MAG: FAD:protein FMN transferase, partial [Gemmatimonadetes bacterium]|nr:FAD:protein FMN transferase [Gemmatimonadota bacterium]